MVICSLSTVEWGWDFKKGRCSLIILRRFKEVLRSRWLKPKEIKQNHWSFKRRPPSLVSTHILNPHSFHIPSIAVLIPLLCLLLLLWFAVAHKINTQDDKTINIKLHGLPF
jgi:hypothetical protein